MGVEGHVEGGTLGADDIAAVLVGARAPVLVVSSVVGRGVYSIGEAIAQRLPAGSAHHIAIEHYMPPAVVREDLQRYRWISNHVPILLYLVYKIPVFYKRKYLRERYLGAADLSALQAKIEEIDPATVICASHRPTFWVGSLRRRLKLKFALWCLQIEYGKNLGYRYQFWDQIERFMAPIDREELGFDLRETTRFSKVALPARLECYANAASPGNRHDVLLVCGYWGQGPLVRMTRRLHALDPRLTVHAVCGENQGAFRQLQTESRGNPRLDVHATVPSLDALMRQCGSVITKPGASTLLEAHASARKIFLLPGMPVAEDNNARFARKAFGATDFSREAFRRWLQESQPVVPDA
jgi:UDP-N-acetylglucosamine:LPS N-acetylglucosamine transferase